MANTQTTVPLFVANQVLTASQQNLSAGTGVPVFATTVTRDAAFGGSNKALAEGQLCYIEASNIVQYYDGAAWATVGPSTASGLTLISTTTIGTTVASVTVSSAFSTTYDNYVVEVSAALSSATGYLLMTMGGSAGSTYSWGASTTTFAANSADAQNNNASWKVGQLGSTSFGAQISMQSPFLSKYTTIQFGGTSDSAGIWGVGIDKNAASSTAFTLTPASGTITGGTIKVYGYANS
jgi:hypothetical protein